MNRGYCADIPFLKAKEQEAALIAAGVKVVYIEGREAETFQTCLNSLRPTDAMAVFGTVAVFGSSRGAILSRIKEVHAHGNYVLDIETGQRSDKEGAEILDRGLKKIHGSRKMKENRKFARQIAKKGARGKLEHMRADRMPEVLAKPIWQHPKLTIADKLGLMNPNDEKGEPFFKRAWTEATARRRLRDEL